MHLRAYKICKKRKKKTKIWKTKTERQKAGRYWIKFVLDQTFRVTFSSSFNQIFMLDAFEYLDAFVEKNFVFFTKYTLFGEKYIFI